jgi:hypothetical protein
MKKKIITIAKNLPKSIFYGFTDAILPHIKESVKEKESEFAKELPQLDINYTRLTSALVFFTLNILAIFDIITFDDILNFLKQWSALLV